MDVPVIAMSSLPECSNANKYLSLAREYIRHNFKISYFSTKVYFNRIVSTDVLNAMYNIFLDMHFVHLEKVGTLELTVHDMFNISSSAVGGEKDIDLLNRMMDFMYNGNIKSCTNKIYMCAYSLHLHDYSCFSNFFNYAMRFYVEVCGLQYFIQNVVPKFDEIICMRNQSW